MMLSSLSIPFRPLRVLCLCMAFVIVMIGQSITWHNTQFDIQAHEFHDCEHFNACESSAANSNSCSARIEPIPFVELNSNPTVYLSIAIAFLVRGPPSVSLNIH